GSPPLYATVEFNVTNNGKTTINSLTATRLVVKRAEGDVVLDAPVQGGSMNAGPVAGLPPGTTQHHSYRTTPTNISPQMTENEAVTGVLTLSADGQEQQLTLPPTRVQFTHSTRHEV